MSPRRGATPGMTDCLTISSNVTLTLTFMGPCIVIIILIYIQRDATLHSLFYLDSALHVSGGTSTHPQERKQLYLQKLVLVPPQLLSVAIVEEMELV
jgi:hypothetical protein